MAAASSTAPASTPPASPSSAAATLWGHPKGLYVLFFTEMWERFSFYGMRALLVFYMTKQLLIGQADSSHIYGLYTGFVYFTPFFGGILADRWLGQRTTVVLGGLLMAAGHFLMAFEPAFYPALFLLVLGNGAFKPNISTQVGALYPPGDPRRDRAYGYFYMGINLGAFFSPLVCGTLGETVGWHWGFGAAGVGMLLGLAVYLCGRRHLPPDHRARVAAGVERDEPLTRADRGKIWGLVLLCALNVLFWGVYEQQGNTLALWADANTDRVLFGWQVPASWFQSLNPLFIFMLVPLFNIAWAWQARRGKEPSSTAKMALGCALLGFSFLVMIPAASAYADAGRAVSMWWLVGCTFLLTVGELYLSPVGLSLVTKLAPVRVVSMIMGVWFLSSFFGNYLAGFLGRFWNTMGKGGYFLMLAAIAFVAALAILLVRRRLRRAFGAGEA